jgi:ADP-heptose:LPS heptosyltransferase
MKFLVIRFSSIGDIVLATPAIRCLKKRYPDSEVHFLTKMKMKAVTEANPYIDKFHYLDGDFKQMAADLKTENFDYIIDLHKNLRTLRLRFVLKAKWYSYQKLSIQKFLLTKFHWDLMPSTHITTRSLNTLLPLDVKDDGQGLDYFIGEKDRVDIKSLPEFLQSGYGAIVIGASYYTKKLPPEKLIELVNRLDCPLILMGGPEDKVIGEKIIQATNNTSAWNGCGVFSLNGSADLIRQAEWVISHDTGLQYIACAFNKRVMAVWGGTSPKLAVEPYYGTANPSNYRNYIVPGLSCQPCSNFGLKKCPKGHFKCMRLQDIEAIVQDTLKGYC